MPPDVGPVGRRRSCPTFPGFLVTASAMISFSCSRRNAVPRHERVTPERRRLSRRPAAIAVPRSSGGQSGKADQVQLATLGLANTFWFEIILPAADGTDHLTSPQRTPDVLRNPQSDGAPLLLVVEDNPVNQIIAVRS